LNSSGQLGDGTTTNRSTPVSVSGLTGAVAISAGINHTCAVLNDGTAKCWGLNSSGQLGDGTTTNRSTPVSSVFSGIYIDSQGGVGIGTISPSRAKFETRGAVGSTNSILGSDTSGISIMSNWPGIGFNMYSSSGGPKSISSGYTGSIWVSTSDGHLELRLGQTNAPSSDTPVTENTVLTILRSGNVGIGASSPNEKLEINGGVRLNTTSAKPICDATRLGTMWFTQGGAGVQDTLEVCAKDASGAYAWRTIY
jgi:hypothetical protein